ncbi:MAG TPA: phytanoyl-CoA dioxygenase family protein, partial [Limnochordia bacterium]|nr:phytanoyl-CoA dioxygenase family protein [Limnochordia bacterium]
MAVELHAGALKDEFDQRGYVVVRGLLSRAEVEAVKAEMAALHAQGRIPGCFEALSPDQTDDPLKVYPRLMHPHRVNGLAKRTMIDPRVMDILAELFGEEALATQSMYYFKPPGARGQALH